jgi:hypothetical protein
MKFHNQLPSELNFYQVHLLLWFFFNSFLLNLRIVILFRRKCEKCKKEFYLLEAMVFPYCNTEKTFLSDINFGT